MTCPFLEYRAEAGEQSFDRARAFCTAADRFVESMRADVCNDRYDFDHERHCEIYLAHADGATEVHADEVPQNSDEVTE